MENFNERAIKIFGVENLDMSIESSNVRFDERLGRLITYLDMQGISKRVLPRLPQMVRKGPCILDVGAGKGRMTRKLLEIAREVVAIEPFAPFYKILKANCTEKKC